MEEFALLKDFAIIMVVAGVVTLLFRKLRQPPVLGYLIAGLLIGPYTLSLLPVTDIHTISLLADIGLVVLLFGIGLEFSWSKIRGVGLSVLVIGGMEITTMICLGYGLGRLLGWSITDAIFLGAALHISSSAIIVKILRDMGRLRRLSSKLIVGILVVEDFAAVAIIAVLSGVTTTGTAELGDIWSLVLRLGIFTVASLVIGAVIVPRIIRFSHGLHSKEALLITSLGLCFAMALLGNYLGLSVAIGAFIIGSLIGDTEYSEDVIEVLSPIRDLFAALFFVAIGMLINLAQFGDFIIPAIVVSFAFILGKILSNTVGTFISGHEGKTSLQVGMGMPQMGEFSLVIAKVGVARGVVMSHLYPVIALATALTSFTTPYIVRSADSVASFFDRRSPQLLKTYVSRLADWLQALRATLARDSVAASVVQHAIKAMITNLLVIIVLIGIATFTVGFASDLALVSGIRTDIIGLLFGFLLLTLCIPFFVAIWRNIRGLAHEAVAHVLTRRLSAQTWRREALRVVLRDSIVISLIIPVGIWLVPFISRLISIGSFALTVPLFVVTFILGLLSWLAFDIHGQLERTFSRTLLGKEYVTSSTTLSLRNISRDWIAKAVRKMKLLAMKIFRRSVQHNGDTSQSHGEGPDETAEGTA